MYVNSYIVFGFQEILDCGPVKPPEVIHLFLTLTRLEKFCQPSAFSRISVALRLSVVLPRGGKLFFPPLYLIYLCNCLGLNIVNLRYSKQLKCKVLPNSSCTKPYKGSFISFLFYGRQILFKSIWLPAELRQNLFRCRKSNICWINKVIRELCESCACRSRLFHLLVLLKSIERSAFLFHQIVLLNKEKNHREEEESERKMRMGIGTPWKW